MNGAGNRFGIFDTRGASGFSMSVELARETAKKGGPMGTDGADQIIVLRESVRADVFMEIWNADGSRAGACGNATRCVAWLLMRDGANTQAAIETDAGLLSADGRDLARIKVDMGVPRLRWDEIPLKEYMDTRVIDVKVGPIDAPILARPGAVSMGNPHCVFFVENAETVAADKIGPMIEYHPLFPEQCNVGFAEVRQAGGQREAEIRLRVWERGAGLTKACGTGACAALVAAHRQGRTGRTARIIMDGGDLHVHWREDDDHVLLSGPVELEFEGELSV